MAYINIVINIVMDGIKRFNLDLILYFFQSVFFFNFFPFLVIWDALVR